MAFLSPIKTGLIRSNSTAFFAESMEESWFAHTIPAVIPGVFLATDIKLMGILASFDVSIIDNFSSILGRQFFLWN